MKHLFPIGLLFAAGLGLWNCDLSESKKSPTLTFHLDDSLKTAAGKYDSVELDLYLVSGADTAFEKRLFRGKYLEASQLENLSLGDGVKGDFIIRVIGFRDGKSVLEIGVPFVGGKADEIRIVYKQPDPPPNPTRHAPVFVAGLENVAMQEGEVRRIVIKARDEDGDSIKFAVQNLDSLRALFPNGNEAIAVSASHDSLVLTFSPGRVPGNYRFRIALIDPFTPPETQVLTVSVGKVNRPPVVAFSDPDSGSAFLIREGKTLSFRVLAQDPDSGDAAVLQPLQNPPWPGCGQGAFDTSSGQFQFTPSFQCVVSGESTFAALVFRARDKGAPPETGEYSARISVADSNSAPKWKQDSISVAGKEGKEIRLDLGPLYLGDAEGDSVEVSATCGALDWNSRSWTYAPGFREAGKKECTITAQDTHTPSADAQFILKLDIGDSIRLVDVAITSPVPGFITRDSLVSVRWRIGDNPQIQDTTAKLSTEGPNTIRRSFQDTLGNFGADSIVVYLDTKAPNAPKMDSTPLSPLNSLKPKWTWRSGGGAGIFRCRVDIPDLEGVAEQADSSFTPTTTLLEGRHVLYVQERDMAGNWSAVSRRELVLAMRGVVGQAGFSEEAPYGDIGLAINNAGEKFVIYTIRQDEKVSTRVKKYNGSFWQNLGDISEYGNYSGTFGITFNADNVPHVWLSDSGGMATVVRFQNGAWEPLGERRFIQAGPGEAALKFAPDGTLYAVIVDEARGGKASVVRFFNGKWEIVGNPGISIGFAIYFSIAISSTGVPYIGFLDASGEYGQPVIRKLNTSGTLWETVESPKIHSPNADFFNITLNAQDTLFLAIPATESNDEGLAFKFTGTAWENIGNPIFNKGDGYFLTMAIDTSGRKFVAFKEHWMKGYVIVKALLGNDWLTLPLGGTVNSAPGISSIVLSPEGVPHIAFGDADNGGRITVYKASFDP